MRKAIETCRDVILKVLLVTSEAFTRATIITAPQLTGRKPATVRRTTTKLIADGLVQVNRDGTIELTDRGVAAAPVSELDADQSTELGSADDVSEAVKQAASEAISEADTDQARAQAVSEATTALNQAVDQAAAICEAVKQADDGQPQADDGQPQADDGQEALPAPPESQAVSRAASISVPVPPAQPTKLAAVAAQLTELAASGQPSGSAELAAQLTKLAAQLTGQPQAVNGQPQAADVPTGYGGLTAHATARSEATKPTANRSATIITKPPQAARTDVISIRGDGTLRVPVDCWPYDADHERCDLHHDIDAATMTIVPTADGQYRANWHGHSAPRINIRRLVGQYGINLPRDRGRFAASVSDDGTITVSMTARTERLINQ